MKNSKQPKTELRIILAIVFFGFLGLSMPYLIFPTLFLNPSYAFLPPGQSEASRGLFLGITLAAYPFGQFLGAPILGALSDEHGRRKILSTSLLVAALCSLLTAFSLQWKILWLLITSRFLAGLMEGNLAIARAMAADIKELNKYDTFGKINAATSIAYVVGPLVGGLLSDPSIHPTLSLPTPFFAICVLLFLLALLSHYAITERPRSAQRTVRTFKERINLAARLRRLFAHPPLRLLMIVVTLYSLAVDIFYEFGPVYLTAEWLLSTTQLAFYNGVLSLALATGSGYLAGRLAKRYRDRQILIWSITSVALGLVGVISTTTPAIMLSLFVALGFAIAIAITNLTVQLSDTASDDIQGEVMGVQTSLRVLGDAIICLLGGALLALSPALILLAAAAISLFSLVYYLKSAEQLTSPKITTAQGD